MTDTVVSDAGPLIALAASELLSKVNKLYKVIYITPTVEFEVTGDPLELGADIIKQAISEGLIKRLPVTDSGTLSTLNDLLDPGEAEAIALAEELDLELLIDEKKGRRVARHRGLTVRGTGAILIKLKQKGDIEMVAPYLESFRKNGYRLSDQLCLAILELCGESTS